MAECDYFVTTDDRLLKFQSEKIKLVTPGEFAAKASAYADSHPFTGKVQVL